MAQTDTLTPAATPAELEHWQRSFTTYFSTSNAKELDLVSQQQFMFSCLDAELANYVRTKIEDTTRVLGDAPSLTATLKERFALKYPIFTRRLQYFSFKQNQGQSYSDFRSKLSELRKQADLESLTADQLEVFRIVCLSLIHI